MVQYIPLRFSSFSNGSWLFSWSFPTCSIESSGLLYSLFRGKTNQLPLLQMLVEGYNHGHNGQYKQVTCFKHAVISRPSLRLKLVLLNNVPSFLMINMYTTFSNMFWSFYWIALFFFIICSQQTDSLFLWIYTYISNIHMHTHIHIDTYIHTDEGSAERFLARQWRDF